MERPDYIEKRVFKCSSCGYDAQVYGEQYFDYGCYNFMATFRCPNCQILFESVVSKMECREPPVITYNLTDEIICLNCGKDNVRVWNKESEMCPKCSGVMYCNVEGLIKINYKG